MGMTGIEKTLAAATDKEEVNAGETVFSNWDLAAATNFSVPGIVEVLNDLGIDKFNQSEKLIIVSDHFHQPKTSAEADLSQRTREFARRYDVENFYDITRSGVAHLQVAETGMLVPGDIVIGADSHTANYGVLGAFGLGLGATDLAVALAMGQIWIEVPESVRVTFTGDKLHQLVTGKDLGLALVKEMGKRQVENRVLEIHGEIVGKLPVADRFALAEAASGSGTLGTLFPPDRDALDYLAEHATRESRFYFPDEDAVYNDELTIDVESLEPQVNRVGHHSSIFGISALADQEIHVRTIIIGGCSGGQVEDLWSAAKVMKYRKVHEDVNLVIIPATPKTYRRMINEGLASIFVELGAEIWPPGCSICPDNHPLIAAHDKNILITSAGDAEYFPGDGEAHLYSASIMTAAASTITGHITNPNELISDAETD